ncbi:hypothetical protein H920_16596 [Fukomys damarensis]|uniref:Uncharacterized protein n=1 Tax=Fukomys damarensis TaxID=885580 RepID=A0A091CU71_FUKDA|nr:hypothetical protein H920_16596 [Fukomys damarensis]
MNGHGAKCTWPDVLEEMEPQLGMEDSFQSIFFPDPGASDDSKQSQQTLSQQLTTIPVSQTSKNHNGGKKPETGDTAGREKENSCL